MEGYINSTQLPYHKRQQVVNAIDVRLQSIPKIHILLYTMMPALSRITTIDIRNIAQLRTNLVALAIERYRLADGKLPESLTELVPAYLDSVPMDPFDGNELRYKKLETGFVVYSIGEDLSDDGGKERERLTKESPNWDVTFIVER
jgi:type II secretory pathway pseudopilin PulG